MRWFTRPIKLAYFLLRVVISLGVAILVITTGALIGASIKYDPWKEER